VLRVLLFVVILGVVIYLAVRFVQRRGGSGGGRPRGKPLAPDDDPNFLRGLDDQLWQERRSQRDGPDDGPSA
jgi:hypothetical protein